LNSAAAMVCAGEWPIDPQTLFADTKFTDAISNGLYQQSGQTWSNRSSPNRFASIELARGRVVADGCGGNKYPETAAALTEASAESSSFMDRVAPK